MPGMAPLPAATSTQFALGSGDELRVNANGLEGFSNNYVIGDNGNISLPFIGDVVASGKTSNEVQTEISEELISKKILINPVVNVQINKYRPIFVIGEVKNPGSYPFTPGTSVLNAISMAGGYTFRAKKSKVAIIRRQANESMTASATERDLIQPGDTIRIFESWF